jgi:hypothetical protein
MSDPGAKPDAPIEDSVIRFKQIVATGYYGPRDLIEAVHALGVDRTAEGQVWLAELEREAVLDEPIEAATASGIARAQLIRLVCTDTAIRRLFAELGHRSGSIHRITLRHEQHPTLMRRDRELGLVPGWEERLAAAVSPWAVEPGDGQAVDIEREIATFLADRHLLWPWLARATVGAFTWYVDSVVTRLLRAMGGPWVNNEALSAAPPKPTDLPGLLESYWNDEDGPRLPEDRAFGPIRLFRNDSIGLARSRVESYLQEVAAYLVEVAQAAAPVGVIVDKRRPTVIRNVTWLFRHEVLGVSLKALAVEEFGDPDRHADVRRGIKTAHGLLAELPYSHPILPLDEYEAGRVGI